MTFAESLIIYLSLGAPVAVYNFQLFRNLNPRSVFFKTVLTFLLWPAVLVKMIRAHGSAANRLRTESHPDSAWKDERLHDIVALARDELSKAGRGRELPQFREMAQRYAGLWNSSNNRGRTNTSAAEFFSAAGHPDPRLAAACHFRKSSARLDAHCRATSAEVRRFFAASFADLPESRAAMAALAAAVGDVHTAETLLPSSIGDAGVCSPSHRRPHTTDATESAKAA